MTSKDKCLSSRKFILSIMLDLQDFCIHSHPLVNPPGLFWFRRSKRSKRNTLSSITTGQVAGQIHGYVCHASTRWSLTEFCI